MFKKITEESRSVINDVAKRVKEKLYREHASVSEVSECIGLLVGLADQSGPELAKLHLSM